MRLARFLPKRRLLALPLVLLVGGAGAAWTRAGGEVLPGDVGAAPVLYVPAPPERCEGLEAALPPRFRVLIWNVYKGRRDGWAEAFAALAADRDLVLLQEAWLHEDPSERSPMRDALADLDGVAWQMVVSWVDDRGEGPSTGVATGARARPVGLTPLVSPRTEPLVGTPKTALVTSYALEGGGAPLLVVNVHALNFVSAKTLALHLDQLEERMRGHEGPILLGGDFNAWSDEKQERLRGMAARLDLAEVAFDGRPEEEDGRTKVFGNPLDYAFVRGLRVEGARVEESDRSDHNALLLELLLEPELR